MNIKELIAKLLIFVAKQWGKVWVFACIPFRAYARSVVYNYVLQRGLPLKRLYERQPTDVGAGWTLADVHYLEKFNGSGIRGHIKRRSVSKLQFYLVVLFIWGWLDDDSNEDTTDLGYVATLASGERVTIFSWLLRPWLKKAPKRGAVVYGNAFDLGDVRARYAYFNAAAAFVWNMRNTAMNFQYLWRDY